MTRERQKGDEVKAVEFLTETLPSFPEKARIEACVDPLDVIVTLPDGSRIGVEVVEFVRDKSKKGSALNAYQHLTQKIARAAEAAYAELGAPPIYCQVSFSRDITCSTKAIGAIAARMARCVAEAARPVTQPHRIESDLPLGIEKIVVHPGYMPVPQFAVIYSDNWEYLTSAHIDDILEEKSPKLPVYLAKCETVWLLIYVPVMRMSGWVEPSTDMVLRCKKTSFKRVFFLYDASRVIEVTVDH